MSSLNDEAAKVPLQEVKLEEDVVETVPPPKKGILEILPSRFRKDNAEPEQKKLVLERPWKAFGSACIIHVPPVIVCGVVIWLDRVQAFWFEGDNPTLLNALQFAAKLLELFILGSLSAMVLHHTRRHMIGGGVPLGLIPATYRVADVQLLQEKFFWHSFLKHKTWRLGVFIAFGAIFSVLVGPSSAIVLLPSAGYYGFSNAFWNSTGRLMFFSGASTDRQASLDMMMPMRIATGSRISGTGTGGLTAVCSFDKDDIYTCPEGTSPDATQWFWGKPGFDITNGGLSDDEYTTVSDSSSHLTYESILTYIHEDLDGQETKDVTEVGSNNPYISVASVPNMNLVRSFQRVWAMSRDGYQNIGHISNASEIKLRPSDDSEVYQPVVQTQCNWIGDSRLTNANSPRLLGSGLLSFDARAQWHFESAHTWEVPRDALDAITTKARDRGTMSNQFLVEWIPPEEVEAPGQFSIAALIAAPLEALEAYDFSRDHPDEVARNLITCVFSAHWMPSTFEFDPQAQVEVQTNWTKSPNAMATALKMAGSTPPSNINLPAPLGLIKIEKESAAMLEGLISTEFKETLLSYQLSNQFGPNHSNYPRLDSSSVAPSGVRHLAITVTTALNSIMAVGLANVGQKSRSHLFTTTETTNRAFDSSYLAEGGITDTSIPTDKEAPLADLYSVYLMVERNGYAYGARTETVTFAMSIIYIYLGVLLLYLAYAFWDQLHAHPYPITSWGGIHDVLVLAMNSTPPDELENCGSGVGEGKTWGHNVKIRTNDEKLELVFDDGPELTRVMPKTHYA